MKGRVGCNILFSTPLRILLANRCAVQKRSSFLIEAWHFLIHVEQYASDRRSAGLFFRMDGTYLLTYLRTYAHNLISKPHFRVLRHWSLRDRLKQYRTTRAVRFVKWFRSDTGGLASLVRRSGFVTIGFRSGWT